MKKLEKFTFTDKKPENFNLLDQNINKKILEILKQEKILKELKSLWEGLDSSIFDKENITDEELKKLWKIYSEIEKYLKEINLKKIFSWTHREVYDLWNWKVLKFAKLSEDIIECYLKSKSKASFKSTIFYKTWIIENINEVEGSNETNYIAKTESIVPWIVNIQDKYEAWKWINFREYDMEEQDKDEGYIEFLKKFWENIKLENNKQIILNKIKKFLERKKEEINMWSIWHTIFNINNYALDNEWNIILIDWGSAYFNNIFSKYYADIIKILFKKDINKKA